jgi:outer membrane protein assembly factor BamB
VFTLFSDGTSDVLMGMSAASGDELWRHTLAPTLEDNGGAEEGPLSTPAVLGDAVYALGPRGQLVAVGVGDGELLWERDVVREFDAAMPQFHLATSPMIFGDLLLVQMASRERGFVCALDRGSGEPRWCAGRGKAGYQSPARMNLGDRQVAVAVSNSRLMALEPDSGEERWTYKYDRLSEEGASHPILAGERRILIQGSDGFALFELSLESEAMQIDPVWENEMFHHNFDVPVYHEGYLYGFGGKLLTCLNARTGRSVWRSKKTGGGNAILVGPFLAVWSPSGTLHMVRATPEGYDEVTSLELLDAGGYTIPSYADGTLFVRNLQEIAAARVLPLGEE